MPIVWPRRNFLKLSSTVFPLQLFGFSPQIFGLTSEEQTHLSPDAPVPDLFPTQPPELVREMVTVSHYLRLCSAQHKRK